MTSQVTQCPKCKTPFRITEKQLTIANGSVRCGHCLHIFDAAEHWLSSTSAAKAEPSPKPTDKEDADHIDDSNTDQTLPKDATKQRTLNDIFDDDIFNDSALDLLVEKLSTTTEKSLPENDGDSTDNTNWENDADTDKLIFNSNLESDDEFLKNHPALQVDDEQQTDKNQIINQDPMFIDPELLDPELLNDAQLSDTSSHSIRNNTYLNLDNLNNESATVFRDLDDLGGDDTDTEDDWAKKLLEEENQEEEMEEDQEEINTDVDESSTQVESLNEFQDILINWGEQTDGGGSENGQPDPELLDIISEQDDTTDQCSIAEDEFILGGESMRAGERIGIDNLALLANIEPEPVEISIGDMPRTWQQKALIAGVFAACLLLTLQYLIFNFDRISRDPGYRPLLTAACSVIPCQVPRLDNIQLIRANSLMVRSHPNTGNALVVDAIISNRASFKQRFPIMELQFTNLSGEVIADRRFKPEHYLEGEMSGHNLMPVKQPIHISLEIVDPGKQAINYQLRFFSLQDS